MSKLHGMKCPVSALPTARLPQYIHNMRRMDIIKTLFRYLCILYVYRKEKMQSPRQTISSFIDQTTFKEVTPKTRKTVFLKRKHLKTKS